MNTIINARYLKKGRCTGPLGFPCHDSQARALEARIKELEKDGLTYKRNFVTRLPLELAEGERADVSIITSTEADRENDVVDAKGLSIEEFQKNNVVTWNHDYSLGPIGRCLWVKPEPTRATATHWKAKTEYCPEGAYDLADTAWNLVKTGFLKGKSIGFLPEEVGPATQKEIDQSQGAWAKCRIIRKATLWEYSVATIPCNPSALVEAVAKGSLILPDYVVKSLGLELPEPPIYLDVWEWDDPIEAKAVTPISPAIPLPKYCKPWSETEAEILRRLTR